MAHRSSHSHRHHWVRMENGRPDIKAILEGEVGTATGRLSVTGGYLNSGFFYRALAYSGRCLSRHSVRAAEFDEVCAAWAEIPGVRMGQGNKRGAERDVERRDVWVCIELPQFYRKGGCTPSDLEWMQEARFGTFRFFPHV